jgi:hypothetical protein
MWLEELGRGIRPIGPILLNGIRPTWRDDQQVDDDVDWQDRGGSA